MAHLKYLQIFFSIFFTTSIMAQHTDWTKNEEHYYNKMNAFCHYMKTTPYDTSDRKFIFNNFIYFDNILSDTSAKRISKRTIWFDTLYNRMRHFIDSLGLENLDAKPVRFFKNAKDFYKPFDNDEQLKAAVPLTLVYYDNRQPDKPLGALLFEENTYKLLAWIILDEAGYRYFLTFNLL